MELVLNKKELVNSLELGGMFAGKSKLLDILDCVKIKVANGHVTFVSSDSENAISERMDVDGLSVEEDKCYCVNFKDLFQYVKLAKGDEVKLIFNDKTLTVRHGKGKMDMPLMDVSSFPQMRRDGDETTVNIPASLLNNWIIDGRNFVSNDSLRPIMSQMYIYCDSGEFGCCSTDGHVLYYNHETFDCCNFEFTLGKGAFNAVCTIAKNVDTVKVMVGERNVMFIGDGVSLITRRAEGVFPSFKRIIPTDNNIKVKVDKREMIEALDRCKLGANQSSMLAKINVDGINLDISCQDIDFSKDSIEHLMVEATGNIVIGFKASLLGMLLSSIDTENVILEMSAPDRPCLVKEDDANSNKTMLIMPMMLVD